MFEIYRSGAQAGLPLPGVERDLILQTHIQVIELYRRQLARGRARAIWSRLLRRSNRLRQLPARHGGHQPVRDPAVRPVPLARIVGSEDRMRDFDHAFAPLQEYTRARWLSVATAWALGHALPAVELIQIGDDYYVRDGHHRISVARAFGQGAIDASVTVWQPAEAAEQLADAVLACAPAGD